MKENHNKDSNIDSKKSQNIIVEGGTLLSMIPGAAPLNNVRVDIKNGRIAKIGSAKDHLRPADAEIIDARGCIIMPGLINGHSHSAMTIFRGYADDLPLKQWLFDKIFPAEAKFLNPDSVYWGSMLACAEMIEAGITGVIEGYFFEDSVAEAFHKSGLRAIIAQGVIDFPAPGVDDPEKNLIIAKEFIEKWLNISDLITPGLFCHSPVTCSEKTFRGAYEISRELSVPLQTHLSETEEDVYEISKKTGKRPVLYLQEIGVLDKNLIAAHSTHLNTEEIEILAKEDVGIVHVPESNMKLASGVAKVAEMIQKGLTVGIGTDGCASNNNMDLFKELDTAAKLSKVFTKDPTSLNAKTALLMATSWGAGIMGLEKEIGTIEKGKKADIIVVDMNKPHLVPLYNPFSTLVYSAKSSDVKDVIVNGKILMKNRELQTLDKNEIIKKVSEISVKIEEQIQVS